MKFVSRAMAVKTKGSLSQRVEAFLRYSEVGSGLSVMFGVNDAQEARAVAVDYWQQCVPTTAVVVVVVLVVLVLVVVVCVCVCVCVCACVCLSVCVCVCV